MNRSLTILFLFFYSLATNAQTALFKEVGLDVGLNYIYPGNDNQEVGAGITILDINNDGWEDFFQSGGVFESKLWINDKGKFVDQTKKYFSSYLDSTFVQSTVSGDFDNDGYTDLFVCNFGDGIRMGDKRPSILFKNIEGKYFIPVFEDVFNEIGHFTTASWGDINNDGYIDLYVTNYVKRMNKERAYADGLTGEEIGYAPICMENKFYLNMKGVNFVELSKKYQLNNDGCGLMVSFTDFDRDADVDILMLNDFGEWNKKGNQLYRNEFPADSFSNISRSSGFYNEIYGMGIGPGDYDNDGDLDYYITNIGENSLLTNNFDGSFTNNAKSMNVDITWVKDSLRGTSWSGIFFDMEMDGDLDLYISKGNVKPLTPQTVISDPNKLFRNDQNGIFTDVSTGSGVDDILSHRGSAYVDFDHDGDLDIISSVIKMHWADFGGVDQRIKIFRNDIKTKNNWVGFKLIGSDSINYDALGSMVEIEINGQKQIREVDAGSGHGSQSSKILYFGTGKAKKINQLTIYWIGGKKTILGNIKTGKVYQIDTKDNIKKLY